MCEVIHAVFDPGFRAHIAHQIKTNGGPKRIEGFLMNEFHPSFAKAIVRSIIRNEGW